jgi:hypothetical protein
MCLFRDGQAACGPLKHVLRNGDQLLRLIHYYFMLAPTTRMWEIRVLKTVLLLSLIPVSLS